MKEAKELLYAADLLTATPEAQSGCGEKTKTKK